MYDKQNCSFFISSAFFLFLTEWMSISDLVFKLCFFMDIWGEKNIKKYQFKAEGGNTSHEYLQVSEGAGRDGLGFVYAWGVPEYFTLFRVEARLVLQSKRCFLPPGTLNYCQVLNFIWTHALNYIPQWKVYLLKNKHSIISCMNKYS